MQITAIHGWMVRWFRIWVWFVLLPLPAYAQVPVVGETIDLDFDAPDAWGMAYVASATLFLGDEVPRETESGALEFAAGINHIPHLDTEQRRVGLGGVKLEDLNKSPVFGRGQLRLGLPWQLTLGLAWTPPVEIDGVKPDGLFATSLERPLMRGERWRTGIRLYAQTGQVAGDITCSAATAAEAPGSVNNPFGCEAPSNDVVDLNYLGAEISAAWSLVNGRWEPFAAFAVTRMDLETQVDALVFGVNDRSLRRTDGTTRTTSLGLSYRPDPRWRWTTALSWTPLDIRRPFVDGVESEDFWTFRLAVAYRWR